MKLSKVGEVGHTRRRRGTSTNIRTRPENLVKVKLASALCLCEGKMAYKQSSPKRIMRWRWKMLDMPKAMQRRMQSTPSLEISLVFSMDLYAGFVCCCSGSLGHSFFVCVMACFELPATCCLEAGCGAQENIFEQSVLFRTIDRYI